MQHKLTRITELEKLKTDAAAGQQRLVAQVVIESVQTGNLAALKQLIGSIPAFSASGIDMLIAIRDELESAQSKSQESDNLIQVATALAQTRGTIGVIAIQRHLKLDYNRAASLLEQLTSSPTSPRWGIP